MPGRYDASMKAKAIRLVREHRAGYSTEYAAIKAVAGHLGMSLVQDLIRVGEAPEGKPAVAQSCRHHPTKISWAGGWGSRASPAAWGRLNAQLDG